MVSYQKYQLKSGETRWRVCYRDPAHRNVEKAGFKRKIDAQDWAARNVTTAINDGAYVDPRGGRAIVEDLGREWVAAHESVWKPSHHHSVETAWRVHVEPKWGRRRIGEIQHSEVQEWVNELASRRSASVVIRAFGVLKGIYDTAVKDGRIVRTPVKDIQLPKKHRKPRTYLTPSQLLNLADCSGEYRPLILVLGLCGLRWGEATALTVADLDFKTNRIHVNKSVTRVGKDFKPGTPKTNRNRTVPMPKIVRAALYDAIQGKGSGQLVFSSPDGGYVHPQTLGHRCWYKTAVEHSNTPPLAVHDLRHTAASIAVHSGANVKAIQRMLGHSSAAMTLDVYADLFDDDLDDVAARVDKSLEQLQIINDNQ